ncbi:MAG: PD40 domain-containing protein [Anaerolineae bacterium]|nr:PD40 domain-containing protein [Anaerolineae bacterium]
MRRLGILARLYACGAVLVGAALIVGHGLAADEIAFTTDDQIYVVDVRMRRVERLRPPTHDQLRGLGWSPDGAALLIHDYDLPQTGDIMLYAPYGRGWRRLMPAPTVVPDVAFAADAEHILFTDGRSLFRAPVDDPADWMRIYSFNSVLTRYLASSPDGAVAAVFGSSGLGAYRVYLVDTVSDTMHPDLIAESYAWSPDGARVVYSNQNQVYLLDPVTRRATFVANGHSPVWSPDGASIAYVSTSRAHTLVLRQIASGQEVTLARTRRTIGALAWRPARRS